MNERGFLSIVCLAILLPLCFMSAALYSLSQNERQIITYRSDEILAQLYLDSSLEIALQKMYDQPDFYETAYKKAPRLGLLTYTPLLYEMIQPEKGLSSTVRFRFINHAENIFCLEAVTTYKTLEKKNFLYLKRRPARYDIISRTDHQR